MTAAVTAQPGAPVLQTAPALGTVDGGRPVSTTAGTWSGTTQTTSYSYVWLSCAPDLTSCDVVGSDSPTYSPTGSDSGNVLVVEVVASNGNLDSVAAVSEASAAVVFPAPTITITSPTNGSGFEVSSQTPNGPNVFASYTCAAPAGTTITSCAGTLGNGSLVYEPIGTYTLTVTAIDSAGNSASESVQYNVVAAQLVPPKLPFVFPPSPFANLPAVAPAPPAAPQATIAVTGLAQSRSTWRLGSALPSVASVKRPPVGTAFSFDSNMAAQVTFAFSRPESGREHGGHCVAKTAANAHQHACTRNVGDGSFMLAAASGENTVRFDGRVSASRKLTPGSYAVTVTATGSGSPVSVGTLHFTIVG